jgi:hypothetical protein
MTYSKTHTTFIEELDNFEALTDPEKFLGPNWETVLHFWKWIDTLSSRQWNEVSLRNSNLAYVKQQHSWIASLNATDKAIGGRSRVCVFRATYHHYSAAAPYATFELISMHLLFEEGKTLAFVPLFDGL